MSKELADAIEKHARRYSDAIDRLREIATPSAENETHDLTRTLGEAVELVRCLRRLTRGRTAEEIHGAFGAPGDFGYETPLGAALARVYRGEAT